MQHHFSTLTCAALASLLVPAALAQSAGAPRLGWLADTANRQALAVDGVPGAARFAAPLALPEQATLLAAHPTQPGALVATDSENGPALAFLAFAAEPQAPASSVPAARPAFASWSPAGAFVLAAFPDEGLLRAYRFQAPGTLSLEWELPAQASAAAISDDGSSILALAEGALVLHTRSASTPIAEPGPEARFTFLAASTAFAYSQGDGVILHDGLQFAELPDAGPAVALLSPAAGRLLVLNSTDSTARLSLWSAQRELLASSSIPAAARALRAAGQPATVWLDAPPPTPDPSPQWIAHLAGTQLRVFFVPPAVPAETEGGELQ